jgi:hypothetical protein
MACAPAVRTVPSRARQIEILASVQADFGSSSPARKNILVSYFRNPWFALAVPRRHKGRIAIVTDVVRNAVDGSVPMTSGTDADGEDVWSWRPKGWRYADDAQCIAATTVAIGKVHRGERAISRKPSRREGRLTPPVP